MKIAIAAWCLALVLACGDAAADKLGAVEERCLAACQAEVMSHQVGDCAVWRERLPRPDLYSLCQDGFDLGVSAGCKGYCSDVVDENQVAGLRLDACTFLRGTPPMDRMRSCQSGFSSAVQRAKDASAKLPRHHHHHERHEHERELAAEEERIPAAAAGDSADAASKKKSFTVKKAPEARNILEMAREEAQAAFMDQRASDL